MTTTSDASTELSRAACLALLATAAFGRLVCTEGALPAVLPVDFVLDPAGIVLRTAPGGTVARAADGSIVALQADAVDPVRRSGWSVTVVGRARTVRDGAELARLQRLPLVPRVGGDRSTVVVVELGIVTGRRLGAPVEVPQVV